MKKILISISLVGLVFAEAETHDGTTASGVVPFSASWELTETDNAAAFPATAITDYDNGYITITDYIQITDFDCNANFSIQMHRGTWTIPPEYSNDGDKQSGDAEVDTDDNVQVLVDNITAGYGSDGLAASGSYGGGYVAISNSSSPSTILSGGLATTNLGHGVESAIADVNLRVLMDWAKDVEGNYSITTTLTIVDTD